MILEKELLRQALENDWIKVQKHPQGELYIYNYTPKAQFERVWNEVTLLCRGLILNDRGEVVARPFRKFFNREELDSAEVPNLPFEVYEKMDGSLGVMYWYDGKPYIATRGSFTGVQAAKANELLYGKYKNTISRLNPSNTYLFEIIYPENRIVVDYGDTEALVLLAVTDTRTGEEYALEDIGFPLPKRYDGIRDLEQIRNLNDNGKEGFVIRFSNNFRMKMKFKEYLRLHRILTQVSSVTIWEYLKEGKPLAELSDKVPDEFYRWMERTRDRLLNEYKEIEEICKTDFKVLESEKETALYFLTKAYPAVLFAMLKQRDYAPIIWKRIRPAFEKPFWIEK